MVDRLSDLIQIFHSFLDTNSSLALAQTNRHIAIISSSLPMVKNMILNPNMSLIDFCVRSTKHLPVLNTISIQGVDNTQEYIPFVRQMRFSLINIRTIFRPPCIVQTEWLSVTTSNDFKCAWSFFPKLRYLFIAAKSIDLTGLKTLIHLEKISLFWGHNKNINIQGVKSIQNYLSNLN